MARVQSSTPGGSIDWQFRCCNGSCGRTYQRPGPLCTHVNHGMELDVPAVAAMHLAYAATFDPSVYRQQLACGRCNSSQHGAPAAASDDAAFASTARWCATHDVYRMMARMPLRERRVQLWEEGDAVRAGFSVCGMQELWRESRDGSELHNYPMEAAELPAGTSARARAAYEEAAEGGADAAADVMPPAVVDAHCRAAKLADAQELRRARQVWCPTPLRRSLY
eukprot:jgi/Tetstr1/460886/TSEL_006043.t1